jgi:mRNA interferase MazF
MGPFAKGDIVLFPFPYTDLSNRKLRPCLVLSDEMGDDIVLCQITSTRIRKDTYCIEVKKKDTVKGSLRIDSYIRANMIFTAHKTQVQRKICGVNDNDYSRVVEIINGLMKK